MGWHDMDSTDWLVMGVSMLLWLVALFVIVAAVVALVRMGREDERHR